MIEFHIDPRSGVAPYRQLVQQVRQALRLGLLQEGDQLPTVKEVVGQVLVINPNTVLKAYRELEHEGLAPWGDRASGHSSTARSPTRRLRPTRRCGPTPPRPVAHESACRAGLDDDSIEALFESAFRESAGEDVA